MCIQFSFPLTSLYQEKDCADRLPVNLLRVIWYSYGYEVVTYFWPWSWKIVNVRIFEIIVFRVQIFTKKSEEINALKTFFMIIITILLDIRVHVSPDTLNIIVQYMQYTRCFSCLHFSWIFIAECWDFFSTFVDILKRRMTFCMSSMLTFLYFLGIKSRGRVFACIHWTEWKICVKLIHAGSGLRRISFLREPLVVCLTFSLCPLENK